MSENVIPTDSVLRRHYEATNGKSTGSSCPAGSGGLFAWLKRIFS